jgi:hypothetical protein
MCASCLHYITLRNNKKKKKIKKSKNKTIHFEINLASKKRRQKRIAGITATQSRCAGRERQQRPPPGGCCEGRCDLQDAY